jgi:hypothetical protein
MQIGMLCHHTFQTLPFRFTHTLDVFPPTPASSSPKDMEKPRGAWQKLLEVTIVGRINWNLLVKYRVFLLIGYFKRFHLAFPWCKKIDYSMKQI